MSLHQLHADPGPVSKALQKALDQVLKVANAISTDYGPHAPLADLHDAAGVVHDLLAKADAYDLDAARLAAEARALDDRARYEAEALERRRADRRAQRLLDEEDAEDDEAAASWDGVDLTPFLDGGLPEVEPSALRRTDGKGMFYSGYNTLFGDSTAGKSMICAEAAREQIAAGNVVLWVEFEEPSAGVLIARLLSMGLTAQQILTHLHFVRPNSGTSRASLRRVAAGALKLCGDQGAERVGLVVVDSVGESLALEGLSMDKDNDFGPWATRIKTFVQEFPQAAVVVIDHGKKGNDDNSKFFPSGTFRKIATVTGAAWLAETAQAFNKDHAGSVKLLCAKDRHGGYRRKDVCAVIHVTPQALAGPDGHLVVEVRPPLPGAAASSGGAGDWEAVEKVAEVLETNTGHALSAKQIEDGAKGVGRARTRAAIETLVGLGVIERTKTLRAFQHTFLRPLTDEDKAQIVGLS